MIVNVFLLTSYVLIIYFPIFAMFFIYLFIYLIIYFIFVLDQGVTFPDNPSLHPSSIPYTLQGDGVIEGGTGSGIEVVKGVGERQPLGEAEEGVQSGATRQNPQKVVVVSLSSI